MATMLAGLSECDLRGAMAMVQALAEESGDRRSFVAATLDRLTEIVPSDLTTLSVCDLRRGTRRVFGRAAEGLSHADRAVFDHHFHGHPLVRFHGRNPGSPTRRISDCLDVGAFRNSALYADYYRRIGINYVMAVPLWIDRDYVVSIVLNRSLADFADAEKRLLDWIRRPLSALYRNLVACEEAGVALRAVVDLVARDGWQMMRITLAGRILDAAPPALDLLRRFFPRETTAGEQRLPESLAQWLALSRSWGLERPALRQGQQFMVSRHGSRLTVAVVPDPARDGAAYLLMKAERLETPAARLAALPLSAREREVLALVAGGKTNAEIAVILAISPRTVQKHLEHVFPKLGVETRTAAAACALAAADELAAAAFP
jgi:DNA-binding CsgD family transcriptional regulator